MYHVVMQFTTFMYSCTFLSWELFQNCLTSCDCTCKVAGLECFTRWTLHWHVLQVDSAWSTGNYHAVSSAELQYCQKPQLCWIGYWHCNLYHWCDNSWYPDCWSRTNTCSSFFSTFCSKCPLLILFQFFIRQSLWRFYSNLHRISTDSVWQRTGTKLLVDIWSRKSRGICGCWLTSLLP